jgi:hypothetical protein
VILEPVQQKTWPRGFFKRIAIKDESFQRPPQGKTPEPPTFE